MLKACSLRQFSLRKKGRKPKCFSSHTFFFVFIFVFYFTAFPVAFLSCVGFHTIIEPKDLRAKRPSTGATPPCFPNSNTANNHKNNQEGNSTLIKWGFCASTTIWPHWQAVYSKSAGKSRVCTRTSVIQNWHKTQVSITLFKVPPPSKTFSSEEKKVFQLSAKRSRLDILRGCTPTEAFRVWTGERVAVY